jgi:hypothetical protein
MRENFFRNLIENRRELNEEVKRKYYLDFYTLRAKIYISLPEFQETYGQ